MNTVVDILFETNALLPKNFIALLPNNSIALLLQAARTGARETGQTYIDSSDRGERETGIK